jgi:hypothetical protein
MRVSIESRRALTLAVSAWLALLTGAASHAQAEQLSLRFQAGQLAGLRVGTKDLPARGIGGFYAQVYHLSTGQNVLADADPAKLGSALPAGFSVDRQTDWQGKPSLLVSLPEGQQNDSGEMEFWARGVKPHHTYLLRFAHRGERLAGEYPPIIHIRQHGADGTAVVPQQNLELLCGSYDWREETIAIYAMEGADSMSFMLHHPAGAGRFWIGPVTLEEVQPSPTVLVPGQWDWERGKSPWFIGTIPTTDISLLATTREGEDAISISAALSAPTARLREKPVAVILSFRLPLDAAGWRWGDYLHQDRTIEPGRDYSNYTLIGRRQFRAVSRFPMAPVAGPAHGIALAVPLTPPLFTRLRYDGNAYLCAEFDLGLAARTNRDTESVTVAFDILRYQPRWGFRAALARYYQRYPQVFASSAKEGGWWIGPSDQVKDLTDFGLQYAEDHFAHPESTKANNQMGIYTCSYSEPWMWRILVSEENDLALAQPLSHYLPQIEKDADLPATVMDSHDYWPAPRRDSARAFLNSVIHGPDGQPQINAVRTYSGTYLEMSTSCLPRIRSQRWGDMNRALLSYRYETQEDVARCAAQDAKVEGVYFDSVGDWSDISAEDHRQEHFPFASFPLTFSYAAGTPVVSGLSAMAEYMRFIRGKHFITMANSDSTYLPYAAPYLDMLGAGENFDGGAEDDQALSHDRSLAYHRSVSFGNSGMLRASPEQAESRFRLLLFYHIYPGIFHSGPQSLERARPLYQKYIPLMRAMGRAGWEPVPWAISDDGSLLVERFGPAAAGPVFLAVRNPTEQVRTCTLTVEPRAFGRDPARLSAALNALTGEQVAIARSDSALSLRLTLLARDTAVVRLDWPA